MCCSDITVANNHNFVCNDAIIHNCDYRGEIVVILINHGPVFRIKRGDRIAQLVISEVRHVAFEQTDELSYTDRGEGGFGSTGVK